MKPFIDDSTKNILYVVIPLQVTSALLDIGVEVQGNAVGGSVRFCVPLGGALQLQAKGFRGALPRGCLERAGALCWSGCSSGRGRHPSPLHPPPLVPQVFANIAVVITSEESPAGRDYFTWRDLFHIVDLICCCVVLFPIVWSIKHLREAEGTRAAMGWWLAAAAAAAVLCACLCSQDAPPSLTSVIFAAVQALTARRRACWRS